MKTLRAVVLMDRCAEGAGVADLRAESAVTLWSNSRGVAKPLSLDALRRAYVDVTSRPACCDYHDEVHRTYTIACIRCHVETTYQRSPALCDDCRRTHALVPVMGHRDAYGVGETIGWLLVRIA